MRTADAAGAVTGAQLGASLTGYVITYSVLLVAYLVVITYIAGQGAAPDDPAAGAAAAMPLARAAE